MAFTQWAVVVSEYRDNEGVSHLSTCVGGSLPSYLEVGFLMTSKVLSWLLEPSGIRVYILSWRADE